MSDFLLLNITTRGNFFNLGIFYYGLYGGHKCDYFLNNTKICKNDNYNIITDY